MRKKIGSGIRYGVRNCARRHCECICSPALKQARVKGAINLTPVFPLLRSPSSLLTPGSVRNSFQVPNHFSRHRYRILGRSRKRFASSFFLFYFTCLARLREQISIVYREHFCHALYVEHINNDGTTPGPVLSLPLLLPLLLLLLLLLLFLLFCLIHLLRAFNF